MKEYGVTCSEVPSVSSTTVQITSHRYLNPNSAPATTAALIVTACDDAVSTAAEPTRSHTTGTNNCDIITINDSSPTTKDQQPHVQEVNKSVLIVEWLPTGFMVKKEFGDNVSQFIITKIIGSQASNLCHYVCHG